MRRAAPAQARLYVFAVQYLPAGATSSPYRYEPNVLVRAWELGPGLVEIWQTKSARGMADQRISEYRMKLETITIARNP